MARYMQKRREIRRQMARDSLGNKCAYCGSTEALEFDHVDPATKLFTISKAQTLDGPIERLMTEVAKCQLLCNPCHIVKTANDMAYPMPEHGTYARYVSRRDPCRCALCKLAENAIHRKYRKLAKERQSMLGNVQGETCLPVKQE